MIPEAPSHPATAGAVAAGLVPGPITAAGTSSNNRAAPPAHDAERLNSFPSPLAIRQTSASAAAG